MRGELSIEGRAQRYINREELVLGGFVKDIGIGSWDQLIRVSYGGNELIFINGTWIGECKGFRLEGDHPSEFGIL